MKSWDIENLDVSINFINENIKDENFNEVFGSFCKNNNRIDISKPKLIFFVGEKICNKYMLKESKDLCIDIFRYYTLYVLAHEIHHTCIYNLYNKDYLTMKKHDINRTYRESELECKADEYAIKYLSTINNIAKNIGELASNLRSKKYEKYSLSTKTKDEIMYEFIS